VEGKGFPHLGFALFERDACGSDARQIGRMGAVVGRAVALDHDHSPEAFTRSQDLGTLGLS
jgi:hypothetical protein